MFRLKSYAATFALVIGLLATFNQTARAESWSWENLFSFGSSENAVAVCTTDPVVVNVLDAGAGSLRQAVIDACPGSTISFGDAARGKIHLTTGPITINKNLTIAGPGADALTIRNALRTGRRNHVVYVNSGVTAVLSGLTVSDGFADAGGGIYNRGNLTVRNATVTNNLAPALGGGIVNGGTLTLVNSKVTGNGDNPLGYDRRDGRMIGGGIYSYSGSSLTITDSTVSGNRADEGGGIYTSSATITVTNSTIGTNETQTIDEGFGGGLYLDGGMATLTNCTVSQNKVYAVEGGGIFLQGGGTLTLINSTVAHNLLFPGSSAGRAAGITNLDGTVNARNSIIAGNKVNNAMSNIQFIGRLTSQGYNLIGSRSGTMIVGDTTGNIVGTTAPIDPQLSPLADNGGPTQTQALLTGSPAINTGNTATSPAADQRGAARVGTADIGAFELNNSANGGAFVAQLPDGFVQTPYSYTIADFPTQETIDKHTYSLTGGALPDGISLSTTFSGSGFSERENVKVSGTTNQTGVFNFSVTTTNYLGNTNVTNYRLQIFALPYGYLDSADCNSISGWAWDPHQPNTPISVNIYADNSLVATVSANQFRQDLLNAGFGNGVHGFSLATPASLKDGQPHQIRVRIVSTMSEITESPKTITCATPPDLTITKTHTGNFTQSDTGKTYTITVTNSGGTASSGTVSMTDSLPNGLAAVDINGAGWNCNFGNLTCTRNDALAGNSSYPAITLTVNVAADAPSSVTNFAQVSGGGETNTGNNLAADQTTINAAPKYSISGTVSYGITPANQTPAVVSGVNLNTTGSANSSAISNSSGAYQLSNLAAGNYTVTPSKAAQTDNNGISLQDASEVAKYVFNQRTFTPNQLIAADATGNGTVSIQDASEIAKRAFNTASTNIVGQWKFAPASRTYPSLSANLTGQDYAAILVGDVTGNWTPTANRPEAETTEAADEAEENQLTEDETAVEPAADGKAELIVRDSEQSSLSAESNQAKDRQSESALLGGIAVSLPNVSGSAGATVLIPVTVGNLSGQNVTAYDLTVSFNSNILQPASPAFETADTLTAAAGGYSVFVDPNQPAGRVRVGAFGTTPLTGQGTLIFLRFTVIGSGAATSQLNFENFQFGEGTPANSTTNGSFMRLGPTAASVSLGGRVLVGTRGLANANVYLTDQTGGQRAARTNSFGYYRFTALAAGETYLVTVVSKRYFFEPQVVSAAEEIGSLNFTASP